MRAPPWALASALALAAFAGCRDAGPAPPASGPPFEARDVAQAGFDAGVVLRVRKNPSAPAGEISWRQIGGIPADFSTSEGGASLSVRTPTLAQAHPEPLPRGIVPLSPRTRGELVFEATWKGPGPPFSRVVRVAAAARATGIPSVAQGHRLLLGGEGFRVVERPKGSLAEVQGQTFEPDAAGRWVLQDAAGSKLSLRSARYDRPSLDCGRSDCHRSAAEQALASPMTRALAARLGDPTISDPGCLIGCHAAGEPGAADGGFAHLAQDMDIPYDRGWDQLPRALRRLGGVGCMSCHGPGAIPEPDARWAILRSDVCAVCHDAPPRYGHVVAWRRSRMARADASEAARRAPCARCHTTSGFLEHLGVRPAAPSPVASGISCVACHSPHGAHEGHLLRTAPPPPGLEVRRGSVCLGCHAPDPGEAIASASEAALLLGQGGRLTPRGGAPHAAVEGGCIGCHMGKKGEGHSFSASPDRCSPCHSSPPAGGSALHERARALWARALARGLLREEHPGQPAHASASRAEGLSDEQQQALFDLSLVLQDPAAWAHNGPYARALLDAAERVIAR